MHESLSPRVANFLAATRGDYTPLYLANRFQVPYLVMKKILQELEFLGMAQKNPETKTWRAR